MLHEDDEVLQLFFEESLEHLDGIEGDLLTIEKDGVEIDEDLVNKVFRAMHTIKGGSSFFALNKIKDVAHIAENVLDRVRKREMVPTSPIVQSLLEGVDALNFMINHPDEIDGFDPSGAIASINASLTGSVSEETLDSMEEKVAIQNKAGRTIFEVARYDLEHAQTEDKAGHHLYLLEYDLVNDIERKGMTPQDVISELLQLTYFIDSKLDLEAVGTLESDDFGVIPFYALVATVLEPAMLVDFLELDMHKIRFFDKDGNASDSDEPPMVEPAHIIAPEIQSAAPAIPEPQPEVPPEAILPAVATPSPSPAPATVQGAKTVSKPEDKAKEPAVSAQKGTGSLRVSVQVLDDLMTLAGELVLTRNQLMLAAQNDDLEGLRTSSQQVDLVTSQLQETIMQTRMQSIGIVFNKFNRVVRDLSRQLAKEVKLTLEGQDVELDKTIIEAIGDPLTHLVRNSLDHGIEGPDARIAAGKPAQGTLSLKAYHEAGQVVIDIQDDGGGINPDRIGAKALEMGVVTQSELDCMAENDIVKLILRPGFSTADQVTDLSGRGVGMDVVVTNLTKLGGTLDLSSKVGVGTTTRIKLPLTLAIIPSLLVQAAGSDFAIPQVNLLQLARIPKNEVGTSIQNIGSTFVLRYRDQLLPIVSLSRILGASDKGIMDSTADNFGFSGAVSVAVVSAGNMQYGLIVDSTQDSAEIVVKPFGMHLENVPIFAGATILGDGSLAPILDISGIARDQRLDILSLEQESRLKDADGEDAKAGGDVQTLLLVKSGPKEQFAIPLSLVTRIERVEDDEIDEAAGRRSFRYRGESIALFAVDEIADVSKRDPADRLSVVIFQVANREIGLLMTEVVDTIDVIAEFDTDTYKQPGILGSSVINDQLTLLLDMYGIVAKTMPEWFAKSQLEIADGDQAPTILVVDDSMFFVNQITDFVEEAGYQAIKAMDGLEAWQQLDENADKIDLILTDIEMPIMDGWEFAERVRRDDRFARMPLIAVTSVSGVNAEKRSEEIGFDEYLVKLDREEILAQCKRYLNV